MLAINLDQSHHRGQGDGGEWAEIGWVICGSPVQCLPVSSHLPFFTSDEATGGQPIFGTRPWLVP